jgi:hypothetical protein
MSNLVVSVQCIVENIRTNNAACTWISENVRPFSVSLREEYCRESVRYDRPVV